MSQGMMSYAEPGVPVLYLAPNVTDEELGAALRSSLANSRRVTLEEFQEIFHSRIVQDLEKERTASAISRYGYKTKRAMYKNMDTCTISLFDDQIEIQPTHQKSLDVYTVRKNGGPFALSVAAAATDAEIGALLREAFTRCTSAIR